MHLSGYIIVIRSDGWRGPTCEWTSRKCIFGSDPSCDIQISLPNVARIHCTLELFENEFVLATSNLDKKFVMKVDGVPLQGTCILHDGCLLTVGERKFRFFYPTSPKYVQFKLTNLSPTNASTAAECTRAPQSQKCATSDCMPKVYTSIASERLQVSTTYPVAPKSLFGNSEYSNQLPVRSTDNSRVVQAFCQEPSTITYKSASDDGVAGAESTTATLDNNVAVTDVTTDDVFDTDSSTSGALITAGSADDAVVAAAATDAVVTAAAAATDAVVVTAATDAVVPAGNTDTVVVATTEMNAVFVTADVAPTEAAVIAAPTNTINFSADAVGHPDSADVATAAGTNTSTVNGAAVSDRAIATNHTAAKCIVITHGSLRTPREKIIEALGLRINARLGRIIVIQLNSSDLEPPDDDYLCVNACTAYCFLPSNAIHCFERC